MGPCGSPGSFRTRLALQSIPCQLQGYTYVSPHPAFVWSLEVQTAGPSTTEPAPQPSGNSSSILRPPTLWDLAGFPLLALNLETPSGYIDMGQHTTPSDFPHIAICVSHGACPWRVMLGSGVCLREHSSPECKKSKVLLFHSKRYICGEAGASLDSPVSRGTAFQGMLFCVC